MDTKPRVGILCLDNNKNTRLQAEGLARLFAATGINHHSALSRLYWDRAYLAKEQ